MLTGRLCGGTPVMSWPSMTTRPVSGVSKPAIMRSRVVLPQPEPPSSANSSPRAISRSTPATAWTSPKRLVTPESLTMRSLTRLLGAAGRDGVEPRAVVGVGINPRVLGDRLVEQGGRRDVGVGVAGERARRRGDLGIEHEVEELVGGLGIGRVLGN